MAFQLCCPVVPFTIRDSVALLCTYSICFRAWDFTLTSPPAGPAYSSYRNIDRSASRTTFTFQLAREWCALLRQNSWPCSPSSSCPRMQQPGVGRRGQRSSDGASLEQTCLQMRISIVEWLRRPLLPARRFEMQADTAARPATILPIPKTTASAALATSTPMFGKHLSTVWKEALNASSWRCLQTLKLKSSVQRDLPMLLNTLL